MTADGAARPDPAAFVRANTEVVEPPLVPEIPLRLATELTPVWEATEALLEAQGLDPPYWAFAWAGGQALARHVLDHPGLVAGKRVLDFAAGCGIAGIAAARAGATSVEASEIDPLAAAAVAMNAEMNGADVTVLLRDVVGGNGGWEIILAGDVCYERPMAERVTAWLRARVRVGAQVWIGDPIRGYLPREGLKRVATYRVRTTREIEDADLRNAAVWRLQP